MIPIRTMVMMIANMPVNILSHSFAVFSLRGAGFAIFIPDS